MNNDRSRSRKTYPVLLYITGRAIVFGGGAVGMRKAMSLSSHKIDVKIIDKIHIDHPPDISFTKEKIDEKSFSSHITKDTGLVVCALDDAALNSTISAYCQKMNIPVNVATSRDEGTIAFPATIECGNDTIAISSHATCPQCSYALKRYIKRELPNIALFSNLIHELYDNGILSRNVVKRMLEDEYLLSLVKKGDGESALRYAEEAYG